jgi:hypothetical protein
MSDEYPRVDGEKRNHCHGLNRSCRYPLSRGICGASARGSGIVGPSLFAVRIYKKRVLPQLHSRSLTRFTFTTEEFGSKCG